MGAEGVGIWIQVASWNTAAVNNNPFEYWMSSSNTMYDNLMKNIQEFVDSDEKDIKISEIFTDTMFDDLRNQMNKAKLPGVDRIEYLWQSRYRSRLAVREFLMDESVCAKRLASMPDRITNTIYLADGSVIKRPSAITHYENVSLSSVEKWWQEWIIFMFQTGVQIYSGDKRNPAPSQAVYSLLSPIPLSKYPALTVEEQEISIGLQILCLAILDSIFLHILNSVMPDLWMQIRRDLCQSLITNKSKMIVSILEQSYCNCSIIFLQEAAASFHEAISCSPLLSKYALLCPIDLDCRRNQNSLILLDRTRFREETAVDATEQVYTARGSR